MRPTSYFLLWEAALNFVDKRKKKEELEEKKGMGEWVAGCSDNTLSERILQMLLCILSCCQAKFGCYLSPFPTVTCDLFFHPIKYARTENTLTYCVHSQLLSHRWWKRNKDDPKLIQHPFISLALEAITLLLSVLIKNWKVPEIKAALYSKDPSTGLEASGLANAPIMNSEWHKQSVDQFVFSKAVNWWSHLNNCGRKQMWGAAQLLC